MTGKKAASEQSRADKRKGMGVAAPPPATATAVRKGDADIRKLKLAELFANHISEDWLNGRTRHKEALAPVLWAREELKGWTEEAARELWALIEDCFNQWKTECGTPPQLFHYPSGVLSELGPEPVDPSKIEPWFCAEPWVSDPVDLLEHLERTKYQPFTDITSKIPIWG